MGFGRAVAMPAVEEELSGILRYGENESIDCTEVPFDQGQPEIRNAASLCADSKNGAGLCPRDSGGPALVRSGSGWEIAGVISGVRNSNIGVCGEYAIFTGVPQNLAFLDMYLGTEQEKPPETRCRIPCQIPCWIRRRHLREGN